MRDGGGEQEEDEQMEEDVAAAEPVAAAAAPTEPVAVQPAAGIVPIMPYRPHGVEFSCSLTIPGGLVRKL